MADVTHKHMAEINQLALEVVLAAALVDMLVLED